MTDVRVEPLQIARTREFSDWFNRLLDKSGKSRILARLDRLIDGNEGVCRGVGSGVMELKIDSGPGYRVYYIRRGQTIVVLLCGGDKSTQEKDIRRAKHLQQTITEKDLLWDSN